MQEQHPFKPFVPKNAKTLILGSFPGKESTRTRRAKDWYYGSKRNQFWKIMEVVFERDLSGFEQRQQLFMEKGIAITDILLSCERRENKNSDDNLINKSYNLKAIQDILANYPIEKILFTGKGVYLDFLRNFQISKKVELMVLPSPSPAYGKLNLLEKAAIYKKILIG